MLKDALKQRNIPILGALTDALYTAMPAVSLVNFISILAILYESLNPYIKIYAPWLNFWYFMAIVVTISIVVLILTYKFIIPSLWTFRNNQMNVYDSVLMDKIDALTKEIQDLKSKDIKTSL